MTNLSKHPLLKQIYDACQAVEVCGASVLLTDAVTQVSALSKPVEALIDELEALKAKQPPPIVGDVAYVEKWHQFGTIVPQLAAYAASLDRAIEALDLGNDTVYAKTLRDYYLQKWLDHRMMELARENAKTV